jgi:RHS repeat-associated protein
MNIVWNGVFDPFGNPFSITWTVTTNLRFPRQYFDAETQLHQNWNRDYDPSMGGYIESDPIRLLGDIGALSIDALRGYNEYQGCLTGE